VGKSTALYDNSDWDLVDSAGKGRKASAKPAAELPAPIAAMAPKDRDAFVEHKAAERREVQKKIKEVAAKREEFLRADRAKRPKPTGPAFDDAFAGAIKSEATANGYSF
jgi:hypothetical protein